MLLGVAAVIAESYERIHRSNLIGMGVLPLQFPPKTNAETLGLTGTETFTITGVTALNDGGIPDTVTVRTDTGVEFDAGRPHRHPRRGGLLPPRRHPAVRPPQDAGRLIRRSWSCGWPYARFAGISANHNSKIAEGCVGAPCGSGVLDRLWA
jgi:hypothetical protein